MISIMEVIMRMAGILAVGAFTVAGVACVTTKDPTQNPSLAEPSATALEPTLDPSDRSDDATASQPQVGPYLLIAPDSADIDDESGALEVEFSVPCSSLQLDRVVVFGGRDAKTPARVGLIYAESECKKGKVQRFERSIAPGMTEYGALANMDQPRVKVMAMNDFQLVPATSVIIEPEKLATVSYSASCSTVLDPSIITAWDPRTKTLAAAVLYPKTACKPAASQVHQLKFASDSDEYQTLGGGEKDLSLRPMWIK